MTAVAFEGTDILIVAQQFKKAAILGCSLHVILSYHDKRQVRNVKAVLLVVYSWAVCAGSSVALHAFAEISISAAYSHSF
jgi:hypothetical protein